ncbi:DUF4097 family beta strand repeat-containing protein [Streptomyces bambusae]|uniref:Adhesin domain-containing protein n=1 Tax=Streptomyces bambusae TaxID=1550616 RepID=A0ABS6Z2H1_9ACTN|nr:DUF4097 domain-containing protein [Streptomyces bambusae]MBW5481599.1 hypothetical protein [Streptomyces bambusae]
MTTQSMWSVEGPQKLTFDEPVADLRVRIIGGTVNVVAAEDGPARLEVTEIDGPPLQIVQDGATLTVSYEDFPFNGAQSFSSWLESKPWKQWSASGRRKAWERSAVVTLTVPAATRVQLATVSAVSFVSGIAGATDVTGVSGDTTLVGLTGPVKAHTVSGGVEAQGVTGEFAFHSVSGALTVVDGAGTRVRADSVSGDMLLDLGAGPAADAGNAADTDTGNDTDAGPRAARPVDIALTSVSGQVAIRLPHPADARVEANTASGGISNAFEDLRVSGQMGAKRITGTLGAGTGTLRATTVSGAIALLRRPRDPEDAAPLSLDKKVL